MCVITLYVAGPTFGLPDPSPFVSKAEVLLKLSGVPYATEPANFSKAPKHKIPYFEDGGKLMGNSTFLRFHLEKTHGIDFDKGLSVAERGAAWAFEKLAEDHLYWALLDARWMDSANFDKGPRVFFNAVPAPIRPLVIAMVKRKREERHVGARLRTAYESGDRNVGDARSQAIAAFIGDKPWLMGDSPCGADASVWSMIAGTLCVHFETPPRSGREAQEPRRLSRPRHGALVPGIRGTRSRRPAQRLNSLATIRATTRAPAA